MRRLIAALACRLDGSRLYGKPLQNLDVEDEITILDHLIKLIQTLPSIENIVLGISEGTVNKTFIEIAQNRSIGYIIGDKEDVLHRLIKCGHKAHGTDVFRVTTESPFFYFELVDFAWKQHIESGNDVTVTEGLPEGCNFEIYTLESLEKSHRLGKKKHRSEYCSLYIREHRRDFKVEVLEIPSELMRSDLRLTVDYPEDLVLCRKVYEHFKNIDPKIPLESIIRFLDSRPDINAMVGPYVNAQRTW